jgi:hypothetical protein
MGIEAAIIGGSALLGAAGSRSAAKRAAAAQDRATEASLEAFRFSKPYIQRSYDAAEGYLADSQEAGAYQGQTLAGPNQFQLAGNNYIGNMGLLGAENAFGITNTGSEFAGNYADLFAQSQQDRMANAQQYAMNNSQPLINAAMRDDYRNLTEQTLPGINMGASASGNMNSSRAGIADAVANRAYDDRRADVAANIQDQLMQRNLAQQNTQFDQARKANAGLQDAYLQGINSMGTMGDFMTGAGSNLQAFDQAALNDARAAFERNRDFGLDNQIKYQQGMLGQAVYNNPTVEPNLYDPTMSTFGGAMQGAGTAMDLYKTFKELT